MLAASFHQKPSPLYNTLVPGLGTYFPLVPSPWEVLTACLIPILGNHAIPLGSPRPHPHLCNKVSFPVGILTNRSHKCLRHLEHVVVLSKDSVASLHCGGWSHQQLFSQTQTEPSLPSFKLLFLFLDCVAVKKKKITAQNPHCKLRNWGEWLPPLKLLSCSFNQSSQKKNSVFWRPPTSCVPLGPV